MAEMLILTGFIYLLVFVAGCNTMIYLFFKKEQRIAKVPAKKVTIGAFLGLITKEGKLRLQQRTEKGSPIIPGVSYRGDYELTGGGVKEKDLKKVLTLEELFKEAKREAKEELGVVVFMPKQLSLYRAVFVNQEKGTEDWALTIPIPPECWNETTKMKRITIDVNPDELRELANRPKGEQLLSGWGKRMCRMSLGTIFTSSTDPKYVNEAKIMLTEIKPDWRKTEFFKNTEEALAQFRRELGLD
ncbi:MAG: hypothetical protein COX34_01500 [Candidatus Nealsonbacteria bacterium CG23_combo_of_CG06-09_8_20_14_all_36_12]|uniref:Nudix hydrolase domain-containing protein n=2 Tax=Candidatus Nealsoniibacteriota TaxID=1817911 RepID=A0A2H0TLI4_9BACT|nr:MAG: hypothetical protein COX34_01500 [Candidatus Nealsonbacteria bacterium CG23_combo_of_CG06-09_8_20_14_all_36_12]PIR73022.1 MAG: hypothetical protein COV26_00690 [Candidatus Nealsonbacteria bacterium CG10_big_fil_rev_8_21_14_0_10_36_23]